MAADLAAYFSDSRRKVWDAEQAIEVIHTDTRTHTHTHTHTHIHTHTHPCIHVGHVYGLAARRQAGHACRADERQQEAW